ncbi:MAG: GNAT family N-acetyltransferase [Anaerolineae bacterium]|nr:GNAT family N-acetyltransferase [Anaerolineae bacterium]
MTDDTPPPAGADDNTPVWLYHPALKTVPVLPLPPGWHLRFYRPGDVAVWVNIQQQSDPFFTATAATFEQYMPAADRWPQRVLFLVNPAGEDTGTITAWNGDQFAGRDMGLIHWVAIVPAAQGQGLAKPMLNAALRVLVAHGYADAWLETGAARLPAINLYLSAGFVPARRGPDDTAAWQRLAPRLKYPLPG